MTQCRVYENRPHRRATIHKANCGSRNFGEGVHGAGVTPRGHWSGLFSTADAREAAAREGIQVRDCAHCIG